MNEKQLYTALTQPLIELLNAFGVDDLPFAQANQSTAQGRLLRCAYLSRVTTEPRGWQSQRTRQGNTSMGQYQQDTYQLMVTSPNDPANPTQLTAFDLANTLRMLVQSPQYIAALHRVNIGIQRPTAIRVPYFQNEGEQYEAHPNFEFTVSYKTSIILSENEIDDINPGIHGI